ncbi:MAG: ABC transporter permease [Thermomicrobiales bacterium]|nr:ABC transporter permease [Thermomicrobiales bacterium]
MSLASTGSNQRAVRGIWQRRFQVFWRSSVLTRACTVGLAVMILIALVPPSWWPTSASEINLLLRLQAPGTAADGSFHLLGTDALGRDLFYRVLAGTRLTLMISVLATLIATITGTIAGLAIGYFRGWLDTILSRVIDIMLAFPTLLLVLALVVAIGQSKSTLIVVLGVAGWAGYTRVIRGTVMSLQGMEYVEASRAVGARSPHIIWNHLLPNAASPILVLSTLSLASIVLSESSVSFLGLGVQPPEMTWGGMIGDGRSHMFNAWWVAFTPGLAIVLVVLIFNVIGDSIRDAFDPRSRADT